jgi:hypothetical protein
MQQIRAKAKAFVVGYKLYFINYNYYLKIFINLQENIFFKSFFNVFLNL